MRLLVACSTCKRQFDASALQTHDHFRCLCGMELEVPEPKAHDASVVRCSSCGAPRKDGHSKCVFCDSDFTLHELDLHTMCSGCMARISDRAKFCHHCATPVLAAEVAGIPTTHECPSCQDNRVLHSRELRNRGVSVLECPSCGGLWLGESSFEVLAERARNSKVHVASGTPNITPQRKKRRRRPEDALYRACPVCKKLMNRKNFGTKSGVIIDTCSEHGLWFDDSELDLILSWIQAGREEQTKRLLQEREAQAKRDERVKKVVEPIDVAYGTRQEQPIPIFELLDYLVDLFRR